jgi:GT2 family glycosyltransferase
MDTPYPDIAVVIPSLKGNQDKLNLMLQNQTWQPKEIQVVVGVRPNGKARNQGVRTVKSDYIVFIDDDAIPGSNDLIEKLVKPLMFETCIGLTGSARILPSNANGFQKRVAAEIPRTVNAVPAQALETNPPLHGYGHSLITTTCCALRRSVYQEAGGFSEDLTSGVDTDFFFRVHQKGYRFLMVSGTYVEHPAPKSLRDLLSKFYWYGTGYGQEAQKRPEQKIGPRLPTRVHRLAFLLLATLWFLPSVFILYSYGYPKLEFGFRPLKALSTYAVVWGYAKAWEQGFRPEIINPGEITDL